MKTLLIDKKIAYDGTQLRSLFAYLDHNILGNSMVAFQGPCNVSFEHMVDGEDLLQQSAICGSDMVHFIIEVFDESLTTGVLIQRLLASQIQNYIYDKTGTFLKREGDDLYLNDKKLSISIATVSLSSVLVHFAVNVSNEGTPVKTCSLQDLKIESTVFAKDVLVIFQTEFLSIKEATYKVKTV